MKCGQQILMRFKSKINEAGETGRQKLHDAGHLYMWVEAIFKGSSRARVPQLVYVLVFLFYIFYSILFIIIMNTDK